MQKIQTLLVRFYYELQLVSLLLIILPAVAKAQAYVHSLFAVGGIIACGVFLLLVSVLGLIGAIRHHQVCLFFYMILLFLIFLLELFISILCLAVSTDRIRVLVADTWKNEDKLREEFQIRYCCCKLHSNDTVKDVDCDEYVPQDCLPESPPEDSKYNYCEEDWVSVAKHGLNYCGGLGLFFSFTEILGVVITFRFRHLKDPRANPNAFL